MEYNLGIRRGSNNRGRENRRDFTLFLPHFFLGANPPLLQSHLFGHLPRTGDSLEAPRHFPGHSPPAPAFALSASAGTALISHLNPCWKGQHLIPIYPRGFQGYDKPRSVIQAEAALPRVGTAWVGCCCPQELSSSCGVSLSLSLIIRTQGRVTAPPSRQ